MGNATSFLFLVKGITSPGTPEQFDQYFIPHDMEVVVVNRIGSGANFYLANSSANALGTNRKILVPGQSTEVQVDDTSKIWFDADSASDRVEVTIQRRPGTGG